MGLIKGYDERTLREIVDPAQCHERLEELGDQRSLAALLERIWLLKVTGQLEDALSLADQAVRTTRSSGTRREVLQARMLRATVNHFRGAVVEAYRELSSCIEESEGLGLVQITISAYQHRARVLLDTGEPARARTDLKSALFLRRKMGAGEEELAEALRRIDTLERLWGSVTSVNNVAPSAPQ